MFLNKNAMLKRKTNVNRHGSRDHYSGGLKEMSSFLADQLLLRIWAQMPGGGGCCGVSANEYSCAHGAQINFWDSTPYLTNVTTQQPPSCRTLLFLICTTTFKYNNQLGLPSFQAVEQIIKYSICQTWLDFGLIPGGWIHGLAGSVQQNQQWAGVTVYIQPVHSNTFSNIHRSAYRAGIFKQSMGARSQVVLGLSYRPARLHRLAESMPWNLFLGSLNVY